jgi:hypothetical protein
VRCYRYVKFSIVVNFRLPTQNITGLAIRADEFSAWKASDNYRSPPDNCFYCPLCLMSVEDSNDAWKEHLVTQCTKNSRTTSGHK